MIAGTKSLCTLFSHFLCLVGIYEPVGGWALPGPLPTLMVNTPFFQMGYGVGVWVLLVYPQVLFGVLGLMVWSLLVDPTFGVTWVLFFFCYTILDCFSVISSLVFSVIFTCKMSVIFLSVSSFYVPKGANWAADAGFFSALSKSIVAMVAESAEESPGIVVLSGNNSTVSAVRSDFVWEM